MKRDAEVESANHADVAEKRGSLSILCPPALVLVATGAADSGVLRPSVMLGAAAEAIGQDPAPSAGWAARFRKKISRVLRGGVGGVSVEGKYQYPRPDPFWLP